MFQKREDCPACGHLTHANYLICTDRSVSNESFALVQCAHCSHVYTNPFPHLDHIGDYYKSSSYISHTNRSINPIHWIYKIARVRTLAKKEKLISTLSEGRHLLDFGCGTGHFLNKAQNKGWSTVGIEPDTNAREIATKIANTTIYDSLSSAKGTFDIITAWHVLEHVPDPYTTLKSLKSRLNSNGKIVLALPNFRSFDAKQYGSYWAGYDVPRHLSHFSQTSLQTLATRLKLHLVETLPMTLDAFYVSLLSEKYMGNKWGYFSAIKTGLKSNKLAKKSGEYSSLIYILTL